jgi:hypothetical protein
MLDKGFKVWYYSIVERARTSKRKEIHTMTTINHRPYWVTYFDLELNEECSDAFDEKELELLKNDPFANIIEIAENNIDLED